jgi:nitrogen regulatory protein PII
MKTTPRKLLTLVAESGLENRLLKLLLDSGSRGYTVSTAHGLGPSKDRASDIGGGNVRVEAVISESTLETVLEVLQKDYFPHYAVTCWVSDVSVIREDRY